MQQNVVGDENAYENDVDIPQRYCKAAQKMKDSTYNLCSVPSLLFPVISQRSGGNCMREGKDPLDARHQEEDVEITTTRANPIDDKLSFGINNSSWLSSILCSHVLSLHYFTHHRAPQQQPIKYPTHVDPHPKSSHSVFLTRLIQPHLILTKRQKILPRINSLQGLRLKEIKMIRR